MRSVPLSSINRQHHLNAMHPLPHVQSIISTLLLLTAVVLTGSTGFRRAEYGDVKSPHFCCNLGSFPRFVHCSHVPSADVQSFPGRKKGHWLPFGFHRNTSYDLVNQALPLSGRSIVLICCARLSSVVFFTRWGYWPQARLSSFLRPGLGPSMAELSSSSRSGK